MKAIIKRTKNKQFMFTLIGKNGRVIATSETYKRRRSIYNLLEKYFYLNFTRITDLTIKKPK